MPSALIEFGQPDIVGDAFILNNICVTCGLRLDGAGRDIGPDINGQFTFYYWKLTGDGSITAAVQGFAQASAHGKAGVMMRDSLDPQDIGPAAMTFISPAVFPDKEVSIGRVFRGSSPPTYTHPPGFGTLYTPVYVRVSLQAGIVTESWSPDGVQWTVLDAEPIAFADTKYVGIALTSNIPSQAADGVFYPITFTGNVVPIPDFQLAGLLLSQSGTLPEISTYSVQANTMNGFTSPVLLSLGPLPAGVTASFDHLAITPGEATNLTLTETAETPPGYYHIQVQGQGESGTQLHVVDLNLSVLAPNGTSSGGQPPPAGADIELGSTINSSYTQVSAGAFNILDSASIFRLADNGPDQLFFHYFGLSGDGSFTAAIQSTAVGAGIMLRDTLDPSAANVALELVSQAAGQQPYGFRFVARTADGAIESVPAPVHYDFSSRPAFLRLTRAGNVVSGFVSTVDDLSPTGQNWRPVGSVTVNLGPTAYVGSFTGVGQAAVSNQLVTGTPAPVPSIHLALTASPVSVAQGQPAQFTIYLAANGTPDPSTTFAVFDQFGQPAPEASVSPVALNGSGTATLTIDTTGKTGTLYYRIAAYPSLAPANSISLGTIIWVNVLPSSFAAPVGSDVDIGPDQTANIGPYPVLAGTGFLNTQTNTVTLDSSGRGFGQDSFGTFNFYNWLITGDATITARLLSLTNTDPYAQAGVAILAPQTNGLDTSFRTSLFAIPDGAVGATYRQDTYQPGPSPTYTSYQFPMWLRVAVSNAMVTQSASQDGVNWRVIQQTTVPGLINSGTGTLAESYYIGLAAASHNQNALATAVFDNIQLAGNIVANSSDLSLSLAPSAQTIGAQQTATFNLSSSHVNPASVAVFPVTYSLDTPAGLTASFSPSTRQNVGTPVTVTIVNNGPALPGIYRLKFLANHTDVNALVTVPGAFVATAPPAGVDASLGANTGGTTQQTNNGSLSITSAGMYNLDPLGYPADFMFYHYYSLSGSGSITARLTGMTGPDQQAKTGIMIRQSLDSGALNGILDVTPIGSDVGLRFLSRSVPINQSTTLGGDVLLGQARFTGPVWLRMARSGNYLSAYTSFDGLTWSGLGYVTVQSFSDPVDIGFIAGNGGTGNFDQITTTGLSSPL